MANQRPPSNDYSGCPLTVSLPAIGFHFVLGRRQCSFLEESEVRRSIAATPYRPQRVREVTLDRWTAADRQRSQIWP
jgi:hypothetical protein